MASVYTIPASASFTTTLARSLIARTGAERDPLALADVTLYLPTRRAARTLNETFARLLGGSALLPNSRPLGDVEEEDFLFDVGAAALTLPPAISPLRRVLLLAALVQRWRRKQQGEHLPFAQAVSMSRALARFVDEVETQGCDLTGLDMLVPEAFSQHWSDVKDFLQILRDQWPRLLAAEAKMNPAARRDLALRSLARRLSEDPTQGLVVAAGSTGSIPATAELLKAIAALPNGFVVLPGLDKGLDEESWNALDPGHPQFGLKQLLQRIGLQRSDVSDFDSSPRSDARESLIREILRPAPTTDAWRAIAERGTGEIRDGLQGLSLVEAAHSGEEAAAISLMLRHALETPGRTAALVTPDRSLARRVAAEMRRWNIEIDDSAGCPLANTPPGTFLSLMAEAAAEKFAPVPLLALLKHPLAAGGQVPADFRRRARQLDRDCLRGPRPNAGLGGIERAIAAALNRARERENETGIRRSAELASWFKSLRTILQPLEDALSQSTVELPRVLGAHLACAEALAASDTQGGASRLWREQAGEIAARLVSELPEAAADLPEIESSSYPVMFRSFAEQEAVRPLHGKHPRLAILGPLEARLQTFDLVILGGLNEGTWPGTASSDPWLSRPMRAQLGLESPERRIGLAAHDFATLACAQNVLLTRALKADGAPTVASRWLQRLQQFTKGLDLEESLQPKTSYASLAIQRDQPVGPPQRMARPRPCPPVECRPKSLSVTEIETWLRDPYAIYARHVLRLKPIDPLDSEVGPLERGSAVHDALERFIRAFPQTLPADANARLIAIADMVFAEASLPAAAIALWKPRFINAARWFAEEERVRRVEITRYYLEIEGARVFSTLAGEFTLRCRADRIDVLKDGSAAVVDYKTGQLPSPKQVKLLLSPQLPLEGAILAGGGFGAVGALAASQLIYIRFGGGAEPGEIRVIADATELIAEADAKLRVRLADYCDPDMPYLPRVMPFRSDRPGDYDHLSRVGEWALAGWEEPEE
ncbi:MAG: double-strand break repair protein AddB [Alphaproteobacteria bacterium]|nr:double-strand break repair protein AddB [Alphaproteobacteria bacterium]